MCKKDNESKLTKEGIFAINTDYYEKLHSSFSCKKRIQTRRLNLKKN